MKLLIINQYFYPNIAATAQLLTDLSEDLADKDIDVTILTSHSSYLKGRLDVNKNGKYFKSAVIRLNSFTFGKTNTIHRILDYFSFYILAILKSLILPKHDVTLIMTNPPLIFFIGPIIKVFKKSKIICLVEDLYPDTAIALGFLKAKNLFVRIINLVSKLVFKYADMVIAISKNMETRLIEKGVEKNKIVIIDNWADKNQIYPVTEKDNWFLKEHNLQNEFIIEYSGNMGLGHDFDTILKSSEKLKQYENIKFLFIGDGGRKQEILRYQENKKLKNIIFLPYQDRKDLACSISAGDISIISLKAELEGCIMPSKLYGILAAARPIIFVGDKRSDIADIINKANCGFQIDEGDENSFIEKVLLLYNNKSLLNTLGDNGLRYFLKHFERKLAIEKYYHFITSLSNETYLPENSIISN